MVEDVFSHGVGFEVAGSRRQEGARVVLDQHVDGKPAALSTDAARVFERRQEGVRHERVERIVVAPRL
jgi:hypothetical protein